MDTYEVECETCGAEVEVNGTWEGDGWVEPHTFAPFEQPVQCNRCENGSRFTITFKVVGWEDFSKMTQAKDWREFFESFDDVHIQTVEVKQ